MSHLFLSYSHKDRPAVERLAQMLETRGEKTWWDRRLSETIVARGWRNEIADKLFECRAMIVIVTEHAFSSIDVHREVEVVLSAAKKPIVPLWVGSPEPAPGHRGLLYQLSVHQQLRVRDLESLNEIENNLDELLAQLREPQVADGPPLAPHSLHSLSLPKIQKDQVAHTEAERLWGDEAGHETIRAIVIKDIRDSIEAGAWTRAHKIIDEMRVKKFYLSDSDGKLARIVEWHAEYMGLVDKGKAASILKVLESVRKTSSVVVGDMPERIRDVLREGWFALIDGGLGEIYSALALPPQRAAAIKLDVMELLAYAESHRDVLGLVLGPEQLPDPAIRSLVPRVVDAYRSSSEVSGPPLEVLRAAWPPSVQRDALERAVEDARRAHEIALATTKVLDEFTRCSSPDRRQNLEFLRDQLRRQADLQRFSELDRLRNALRAWNTAMDDIGRGDLRSAAARLDDAIEFDGVGAFRAQLADAAAAGDALEAAQDLAAIKLLRLADRRRLALAALAATAGLAREEQHAYAAIEAAHIEAAAEWDLLSALANCPDQVCPWGLEAAALERALCDLARRPSRAAAIALAWSEALAAIRGAAAAVGKAAASDGRTDLPELVVMDAASSTVAVLLWFKKAGKHTGAFESVLRQAEDALATLLKNLGRIHVTSAVGRVAANLAVIWRQRVTEAVRIGGKASQVRAALRSNAYDDAITGLLQLLSSHRDADPVVQVLEGMKAAEQEIAAWLRTEPESVSAAENAPWSTYCEALARQLDGTFLEGVLDDRSRELADRVSDHARAVATRKHLAEVRGALTDGDRARARVLLEAIDTRGLAAGPAQIMERYFDVLTALDALAIARDRARPAEARIDPKTGYAPEPVVIDAEERRVLELERALSKVAEILNASLLPVPGGHATELAEVASRRTRLERIRAYGQMVHEVRDLAACDEWEGANQKASRFLSAEEDEDLFDQAGPLLGAVKRGHNLAIAAIAAKENESALEVLLVDRENDLSHPMLASWAERRRRAVENKRARLRRWLDAAVELCKASRITSPLALDLWLQTPMAHDRDRLGQLEREAQARENTNDRGVDAAIRAVEKAAGPRNVVSLLALTDEVASRPCCARQRPATHHDLTVWALRSSDVSPAGLRRRIETLVGTLALLDGCAAYREQLERESGEAFPLELRDADNAGKMLGAWLSAHIAERGGVWGALTDRGSWAALWEIERRAVCARVEAGGLPDGAWPYGPLCAGLLGLTDDLVATIRTESRVRPWFGPLAHPLLIQGHDPLAALEALAEPGGSAEAPGYRGAPDPTELLAADRRALRTQTLDMILGFRLSADQRRCAGDPVELGVRLREYADALIDEYRGRDGAARTVTERMQDALRRLLKHLSGRRRVSGPPWTPERGEALLGEVDRSLAVIEGAYGQRSVLRGQRADLLYFLIGLYFDRWTETADPDAPGMVRMLELADQARQDAPSDPEVFVNRAYLRWARVVSLADPSKEEVEVQAEVEALLAFAVKNHWPTNVVDNLLQFNDIARSTERQMTWLRNLQFGRERS